MTTRDETAVCSEDKEWASVALLGGGIALIVGTQCILVGETKNASRFAEELARRWNAKNTVEVVLAGSIRAKAERDDYGRLMNKMATTLSVIAGRGGYNDTVEEYAKLAEKTLAAVALCEPQKSYAQGLQRGAEILGYLLESDETSRASIEEAINTMLLEAQQ